ncbi:hypothetical protein CRENBAI_006474, partial [Crenichthys baileyi]
MAESLRRTEAGSSITSRCGAPPPWSQNSPFLMKLPQPGNNLVDVAEASNNNRYTTTVVNLFKHLVVSWIRWKRRKPDRLVFNEGLLGTSARALGQG